MGKISYSDEQRAEYLELAAEIGIGRAMRQLGYPLSWTAAKRWTDAAGIEIPLDEIKAQARAHHEWYQTEELLWIIEKALRRIAEAQDAPEITADEQKKLGDAFHRYSNQWLILQGKANNIKESRVKDSADLEIMDLINAEQARNHVLEKEDESY